jgi:hypothetical protein
MKNYILTPQQKLHIKEYRREWYLKNKERIKNRVSLENKKYRENNRESFLARNREYYKKNKEKISKRKFNYRRTPRGRFIFYKHHCAEVRGFSWELTFEDFMKFWQKPCSYCGDNIETIGIDRVNNKIGYTKENSISCCHLCNLMKRTLTIEDFLKQCNKICKNFKGLN